MDWVHCRDEFWAGGVVLRRGILFILHIFFLPYFFDLHTHIFLSLFTMVPDLLLRGRGWRWIES